MVIIHGLVTCEYIYMYVRGGSMCYVAWELFVGCVEEEVCAMWLGKPHSTYFFLNNVLLLNQLHSSVARKIYVLCGLPSHIAHTSSSRTPKMSYAELRKKYVLCGLACPWELWKKYVLCGLGRSKPHSTYFFHNSSHDWQLLMEDLCVMRLAKPHST